MPDAGLILEPIPYVHDARYRHLGKREIRISIDGQRTEIRSLLTGEWYEYTTADEPVSGPATGGES